MNPTTTSTSSFWEHFMNGSVKYQGIWKKDKHYYLNDIVKHDDNIYLCTGSPSKGSIDSEHWLELSHHHSDSDSDLTSTSKSAFSTDTSISATSTSNKYNSFIETFGKKNRDSLQRIADITTIDGFDNSDFGNLSDIDVNFGKQNSGYYYAVKTTDFKYPVSSSKKNKWYVPISFEKVLESCHAIEQKKNMIIFNKPGTYKITAHFTFTGVNYFKTLAYLLKPSDNSNADAYQSDRKIPASKMSIASVSGIKNRMNYTFPVKVLEPLSSLIMVSVHHLNKVKHMPDEKEMIIYGREKSFILVERID